MALHSDGQVVRTDAVAIIADADQPDATLFQIDINPAGASIKRIFDQFLDYRKRAFDHFAGGNLINQDIGQFLNAHSRSLYRMRGHAAVP